MAEVFDFGLQQHKIKMDGKFFESNLFAVAGDTGRRLEVQLLDSDNMIQNTTGISLRLNAKVAGQATYAEATLVDATKGLYELDLPNGMLIAPGNWQFQWQIIGETGEKLHSFAFTGSVGSNLSEGGSEATNFYLNVDDLKQMQDDLVNGTFNSEVLETNIAEKLEALEETYAPRLTEVTAQLEQTEDDMKTKTYSRHTTATGMRPMVTFYLDDGYQADYDVVLPKASALDFPLTISVYNGSPLSNTPARLDELVNEHGWELHGHSTDGLSLKGLSYDEQVNRMKINNSFYENLGHTLSGICYPIGLTDENTLKAARYVYEVGIGSDYGINYAPIDTFHVKRLITDVDLVDRKAQVDKILADGQGWIVFYSHAGQFAADPFKKNNFFEMMDYVKSKGIDVVTVGNALKVYGNVLDIGDKSSIDYLKIGQDGLPEFTGIPFVKDRNNVSINARLGIDFKPGFVSINSFASGNPSDIPFDSGIGTLYTDRTYESRTIKGSLAFQKFVGYRGQIVTRYYSTSEGWSVWSDIGILNKSVSNVDGNSLISAFPLGKISTNSFAVNEGVGLPDNGVGTLITDRSGKITGLHYQVFVSSNKIYKRSLTGSLDWSKWYQYSPVRAGILPPTYFGSLSAGASSTKEYTVAGLEVGDVVNLNLTVPQVGFIYTCSVTAKDVLSVTVYNVSTAVINITTTFRYSVVSQ